MSSYDLSSKLAPSATKNQKKDGKLTKVENLRNWTLYEYIVYNLDVLVPEDEPEEIFVPAGSYLQKVSFRKKQKWRVLTNPKKNLPEYLKEDQVLEDEYNVFHERESWFPILDPSSRFMRRWDLLTMVFLLFTAIVTPYETA